MNRVLTAVKECLVARAVAGDILNTLGAANIRILDVPEYAALPCITIWQGTPAVTPIEAEGGSYRFRHFRVEVVGSVAMPASSARNTDALALAAALGDLIERAILDNKLLVTTSFASGLLGPQQRAELEAIEYFSAPIVDGGRSEAYHAKLIFGMDVVARGSAMGGS